MFVGGVIRSLLKIKKMEKNLVERKKSTCPVLRINDHATGGRRTKDILGGPKSLDDQKLVELVEFVNIYAHFGRTKQTKNLRWEDQNGF